MKKKKNKQDIQTSSVKSLEPESPYCDGYARNLNRMHNLFVFLIIYFTYLPLKKAI
jgi:hypothetical protein